MKTTIRAALATGLLIGYYLLVLAVLAIAALACYLMIERPSAATIKIGLIMLAGALPALGALIATARHRPDPPDGLPADRAAEPALWAAIDGLAARLGTRPPDELKLVPDVNAAVAEETRWFGLAAGRRHMIIGVPLLEALTIGQLHAVLGHELGHYSGRHTRLGGITYRGATALQRTLDNLSTSGYTAVLRAVFEVYAKIYFRVSQAVRRAQEIEADRFMVEISGRHAAATALQTVRTTGAAWAFFLDRLAAPGTRYGLAPADLFGGFRALLADPDRRDELCRVLAEPEEPDPYDSHPTLAERITAIGNCPEPPGTAPDERPAALLLRDPAAVRDALHRAMFDTDATALDWDELAARTGAMQAAETALELVTAAEHTTGTAPAALGTVLDDLERGAAPAFADALAGGRPGHDPMPTLVAALRALVSSALQASDRVAVRCSWTGDPIALTAPDGTRIDPDTAVPPAFTAAHVPALRDWLRAWGADLRHRPAAPERAGLDLIGVLHGAETGDGFYDVLVLDIGLLFARVSTAQAMRGGVNDTRIHERIEGLLNRRPAELLRDSGNWLLPADAIVQAAMWQNHAKWTLRFHTRWTDDDGTPRETHIRVTATTPCSPPPETRRTLQGLLGARLTMSRDKI